MSKNKKIILVLSGISVILLFYIVFSVKQITISSDNSIHQDEVNYEKNEVEKISQEQISANYKVSIDNFWSDYETTLKDIKNFSFEEIDSSFVSDYNDKIKKLRIEAMSYTVPLQYKDMHLKLVMSLSSLTNFLETRVDANKERALSLYMEAKNEYQNL